CSKLLLNAYDHKQFDVILQTLSPSKKNLSQLMLMLESNHEKGLQDWLIDHFVQEYKRENFYIYTNEAFVKKVHACLGIEAFDLVLAGKNVLGKDIDFKDLLESIRR